MAHSTMDIASQSRVENHLASGRAFGDNESPPRTADANRSMSRSIKIPFPRWPFLILSGIAVFILAATLVWAAWRHRSGRAPAPSVAGPSTVVLGPEASRAEVKRTCGSCHTYPPLETFPKRDWPREVQRGYSFLEQAKRADQAPPFAPVLAYYQRRAPETLPELRPPRTRNLAGAETDRRVDPPRRAFRADQPAGRSVLRPVGDGERPVRPALRREHARRGGVRHAPR
jgi:mono/diheme cytochrome c family protein